MLHGYPDKGLGQRKLSVGFGFGVLLGLCNVGYILVSKRI
jgi:hypothetical protein